MPRPIRPCAGCPEVDDLPRIAVQSDDGRRWTDFHLHCAETNHEAVAAARGPEPVPALKES